MSDLNLVMIEECPDDAVLLDVGANKGSYTIRMANKPSSKVYAFEPAPDNLKNLRETLKDKTNVEIHGVALSDHTGIDQLMLVGNPGGHSIEKVLEGKRWKHTSANTIPVAVITLDEWCDYNNITRIDGIKIDVEAHEEAVLRGAKETLKKYHPLVSLETHQTVNIDKIKELLSDCGYEVPEDMKMDKAYLLRPCGPKDTQY